MKTVLLLHPNSQIIFDDLCQNLPQGLLVVGRSNSDKDKILHSLVKIHLGQNSASRSYIIKPIEGQKSISIDQIRELKPNLRLKSIQKRIVIIPDASLLTIEAQNSILKILEEPGLNIHFLFASSSTNDLLPTILSRLFVWNLMMPTNLQLKKHFSNYPKELMQKALVVGKGNIDTILAVLEDNQDNSTLNFLELAKTILSETRFKRLCRVDILSKDKTQLLGLLDGLEVVCHAALENVANKDNIDQTRQWITRLETVIKTRNNLFMNIQTKLLITNLMTVL